MNPQSVDQTERANEKLSHLNLQQIDLVERLYRENLADFKGFAFSIAGNEADAEDLIHDAVISVIVRSDIWTKSIYEITGLIILKISSSSRDCFRRKVVDVRYKKAIVLRYDETDHKSTPKYSSDDTDSAICRLTEEDQRLIELKYQKGYSQKEIAEILRMSEATVSRKLNEARTRLRGYLEEK